MHYVNEYRACWFIPNHFRMLDVGPKPLSVQYVRVPGLIRLRARVAKERLVGEGKPGYPDTMGFIRARLHVQ